MLFSDIPMETPTTSHKIELEPVSQDQPTDGDATTAGNHMDMPLLCHHCDYDLRGNLSAIRCPECDKVIEWEIAKRRGYFSLSHWRLRIVLAIILVSTTAIFIPFNFLAMLIVTFLLAWPPIIPMENAYQRQLRYIILGTNLIVPSLAILWFIDYQLGINSLRFLKFVGPTPVIFLVTLAICWWFVSMQILLSEVAKLISDKAMTARVVITIIAAIPLLVLSTAIGSFSILGIGGVEMLLEPIPKPFSMLCV